MSIDKRIQELMEAAENFNSVEELNLTLEDLEELTEEEISTLIENVDSLDEMSKATLATYVGNTANMGSEADGGATSKIRAGLSGAEGSNLPTDKTKKEMEDSEIVDASGREKGTKTKEQDSSGTVAKAASRMKVEDIDLGGLFDGEELSEEFKAKATTIFEAAVAARVVQEVQRLEESLAQQALNESDELKEGLIEKVDGFLNYVVEKWMNDNELALDRGIKVEIFESFFSGMKTLFESHNVTMPDEQYDLLEATQEEVEALKEEINEVTASNIALVSTLNGVEKMMQIEAATEGLSDVEAEKFATLAEEIVFEDNESFAEKLQVIRENYFKAPKEKSTLTESFMTDTPVELKEEVDVKSNANPEMAAYVRALAK